MHKLILIMRKHKMRHSLLKNRMGEPILPTNTDAVKVSQGSYLLSLILGWKLYWTENALKDVTGQMLGSKILLVLN